MYNIPLDINNCLVEFDSGILQGLTKEQAKKMYPNYVNILVQFYNFELLS
jgi:hypothetical protein